MSWTSNISHDDLRRVVERLSQVEGPDGNKQLALKVAELRDRELREKVRVLDDRVRDLDVRVRDLEDHNAEIARYLGELSEWLQRTRRG